jgi:hypothetical protein
VETEVSGSGTAATAAMTGIPNSCMPVSAPATAGPAKTQGTAGADTLRGFAEPSVTLNTLLPASVSADGMCPGARASADIRNNHPSCPAEVLRVMDTRITWRYEPSL